MRLITGNFVYEFKAAQNDAVSNPSPVIGYGDSAEFLIELKFRKFQLQSRSPEIEQRRLLLLLRSAAGASMLDALQELGVPEQVRDNMVTNFKFHLDRISRLNLRPSATVSVDVREISPEKAADVQRRMEAARRESNRSTPQVRSEEETSPAPAKRSAVEALERETVKRSEEVEDERECGICLERFAEGEEVIKMPCFHAYHTHCIILWLERNHFCPFCHLKLPS